MPSNQEVAAQAKIAARCFESVPRTDGSGTLFVRLKAGSPDWVRELLREAHCGMLPDDYRYNTIQDACWYVSERCGEDADADMDDAAHEFADNTDVYTGLLTEWVASSSWRPAYVNEGVENVGSGWRTLDELLMLGQYTERAEVFGCVVRSLTDHAALVEVSA